MDDQILQREVLDADKFNNTAKGNLINGKVVADQFRIKHPGELALNRFVFADGAEHCETDGGARRTWTTEKKKSVE